MTKRRTKESTQGKAPDSDWGVTKETQDALLTFLSDEFSVASRNNDKIKKDFNDYYNMIHMIRETKPNEWEPDIYMPEFVSRLLTQIGNFVGQYFGSTDFVECDMDTENIKDIAEGKAAKRLLNFLLNEKEAYYYHKVIRLLMFVFSGGYGIIKGGYEQETIEELDYYDTQSQLATHPETGEYLAEDGFVFSDPTTQRAAYETTQTPVYKTKAIKDRPTFDIYPPVNVYMSPEYTYTLNDKEYIIFETEKTLDELRSEQEQMGYFNLDLLDEVEPEGERGADTYNKDENKEEQPTPVCKTFIILERWGKFPVIEKDNQIFPALEDDGTFTPNAQKAECIIYYAKERGEDKPTHIIGFRKSPHSKRPMVRFLCYVDMIKDCGFGDGEVVRELQTAVNDNYNLMNYRTQLAIKPAFKGKKFSGIPEQVNMSPENVIMMENIDDLAEIAIQDNIQGGVLHHNMLTSRIDYAMATSPQSMGMSPERRETATMASIIATSASTRVGMKSMNLEFIGFTEFYDMLLTLCNDFMLPETLEDILGEEAYSYNPERDDKFKPVSQALETEESKTLKIKTWQGILGMAVSMPNPKTPMVMNYVIGQMLELMGGSFKHFKRFMFNEDAESNMLYMLATGAKGAGTAPGNNPTAPSQNQTGLPQSNTEQGVRGM